MDNHIDSRVQQQAQTLSDHIQTFFNACDDALSDTKPPILSATKFTKRHTTVLGPSRPPKDLIYQTNEWYISGSLVPNFPTAWWALGYQTFATLIDKHIDITQGFYQGQRVTIKLKQKGHRHWFLYVLE